MKSKANKTWKKRLLWVGALLMLGYLLIGGEYNFYNLFNMKTRKKQLAREIIKAEKERETLYNEIDKLKNDSTYIEKIAREEYMMGKKEEKIYIIKSKDKE